MATGGARPKENMATGGARPKEYKKQMPSLSGYCDSATTIESPSGTSNEASDKIAVHTPELVSQSPVEQVSVEESAPKGCCAICEAFCYRFTVPRVGISIISICVLAGFSSFELSKPGVNEYFQDIFYTCLLLVYATFFSLFERGCCARSLDLAAPVENKAARGADGEEQNHAKDSAQAASPSDDHAAGHLNVQVDVHGIPEASAMECGESSQRLESKTLQEV